MTLAQPTLTALGPVARAGERYGDRPRALSLSFEFSPPRTPEMEDNLWTCIRRLAPLDPTFVSVTLRTVIQPVNSSPCEEGPNRCTSSRATALADGTVSRSPIW